MFVDRVNIVVEGGRGGDGCLSFRREKYVPRGGPDGGDGGHGGSVLLVADSSADSLAALTQRHLWKAESGKPGGSSHCTGRSGADVVLRVPPGTLVIDSLGEFTLKDLADEGAELVAARGGKGGRGNAHFKTSENRAPREITPGEPGERRELVLELKLIADVGLLGMPNAGKSTLISRLSRARPEIAPYPFTTKRPHLGIVQVGFDHSFVMADIPGLIEGAHAGAGLGLEFLRHVERTRVLVHLVEPTPADGSDPVENYFRIREEISLHSPELAGRPEIPVVSKCELPGAEEVRAALQERLGRPVLDVSAATGKHLDKLLGRVLEELAEVRGTVS